MTFFPDGKTFVQIVLFPLLGMQFVLLPELLLHIN